MFYGGDMSWEVVFDLDVEKEKGIALSADPSETLPNDDYTYLG